MQGNIKISIIIPVYNVENKRFVIISQSNKGVSTARNIGMQYAAGEYIMFVDSDDYIARETCELIYNSAIDRNCDILLFPFYRITKNSSIDDGRLINLSVAIGNRTTTFSNCQA